MFLKNISAYEITNFFNVTRMILITKKLTNYEIIQNALNLEKPKADKFDVLRNASIGLRCNRKSMQTKYKQKCIMDYFELKLITSYNLCF